MATSQRIHWKLPATSPHSSETVMRFYNQQHRFYSGVDLHARTLSGLLFCGDRGKPMHGKRLTQVQRGKKYHYDRYTCSSFGKCGRKGNEGGCYSNAID